MNRHDLSAGIYGFNRVFSEVKDFTGHQFKTMTFPTAGQTLVLNCLLTALDKRFRLRIFLKKPVKKGIA
ncbi:MULTISPECIES: hypothetical protein [Photorhabdus]|uniref:hypothetical protein n=1 Tax=Photorhabdus TaxID=29487 RepID=UPI00130529AB|nr:hypothetical protein [Photorhabdus asymbiotica]